MHACRFRGWFGAGQAGTGLVQGWFRVNLGRKRSWRYVLPSCMYTVIQLPSYMHPKASKSDLPDAVSLQPHLLSLSLGRLTQSHFLPGEMLRDTVVLDKYRNPG